MIKTTLLTATMTFAVMILATLSTTAEEIKAANVSTVRYQDPDSATERLIQIDRFGENNDMFQEHSPNGVFTFRFLTRDE